MKPASRLCASLLAATVLWTAVAAAQATSSLDIVLRAPTSVRLDEVAEFQVILTNRHVDRAVALRGGPGFAASGGLVLVFVDEAGARHVAPHAHSEVTVEQARDGSRALLLQPQNGVSLHRRGRVDGMAPGPGRYRAHVEYRSPTPLPSVASATAIENATAVSPSVEIEVRP